MADPQTTGLKLYQPTHASDVDSWDQPVNANAGAVDSLFTGIVQITLSNANVTLTQPPNSGAAWAGPYQSQSTIFALTGTLSADIAITLPRSGFWIFDNRCVVGAFIITVLTGASEFFSLPPGEVTHIYKTPFSVRPIGLGRVGSYLDLATATMPRWMFSSNPLPYLLCDGSTFDATAFPVLNTYLGGNTLPDLRGRLRAALNAGTGRITSSVDGNTLRAAGGQSNVTIAQGNLPNYDLPVNDPGHPHSMGPLVTGTATAAVSGGGGLGAVPFNTVPNNSTQAAVTNISVNSGGSGFAMNVLPPICMGGITLVRAG